MYDHHFFLLFSAWQSICVCVFFLFFFPPLSGLILRAVSENKSSWGTNNFPNFSPLPIFLVKESTWMLQILEFRILIQGHQHLSEGQWKGLIITQFGWTVWSVGVRTGDTLQEKRVELTQNQWLCLPSVMWLTPESPGPCPMNSGFTPEGRVWEMKKTHSPIISLDTENTISPLAEVLVDKANLAVTNGWTTDDGSNNIAGSSCTGDDSDLLQDLGYRKCVPLAKVSMILALGNKQALPGFCEPKQWQWKRTQILVWTFFSYWQLMEAT